MNIKTKLHGGINYCFDRDIECLPCEVSYDDTGKKNVDTGLWEDKITREQALSRIKPSHNAIAIKTGKCSGLWVLDIDCKQGRKSGFETLKEKGIEIPEGTPYQFTPSGGAHYFFSLPAGYEKTRAKTGIGLDVRADKGLIFTDAEGYLWIDEIKADRSNLQLPPAEVLALFEPSKKPEPLPTIESEVDPLDVADFVNQLLQREATKDLFNGDLSKYDNDHSRADQALCDYIVQYTVNPLVIDEVFRESGLYREKWERQDYRDRTISNALKGKPKKETVKNTWNTEDLSPLRFFQTNPKPVQWILKEVLAQGLVGFIYGEGGSYKSIAALWLVLLRACVNILPGLLWLAKFPVLPGRSIFFSAEDVEIDLHHRVRTITGAISAGSFEIPESDITKNISENCLIVAREQWTIDRELFLFDEKETSKIDSVINLTNEFKADLLILETYSRIFNVDEIDNQQAARAVAALERIRDLTGATVLCIAHSSKAARSMQSDVHGQNGLRGAGALMDNARFGLWFQARKADETGASQVDIINAKNFRCKRFDKFTVSVTYPQFSIVKKTESEPDLFNEVVEFVKNHPGCKQREIRGALKGRGGNQKITQAIRDAQEEGVILSKSRKEGYFYAEQ